MGEMRACKSFLLSSENVQHSVIREYTYVWTSGWMLWPAKQGVGDCWGIEHLIVLEEYQGSLCWVRPSSLLKFVKEKCLQISASSSKSGTLYKSRLFYHSFREEKWKYQKELLTSYALHIYGLQVATMLFREYTRYIIQMVVNKNDKLWKVLNS